MTKETKHAKAKGILIGINLSLIVGLATFPTSLAKSTGFFGYSISINSNNPSLNSTMFSSSFITPPTFVALLIAAKI